MKIKGSIITVSGIGSQIAISENIIEKEADYILSVKGNQKGLGEDVESACKQYRPFLIRLKWKRSMDG
jgi:predicted transposase YbfD/YdcC